MGPDSVDYRDQRINQIGVRALYRALVCTIEAFQCLFTADRRHGNQVSRYEESFQVEVQVEDTASNEFLLE